jgi:hypothetical protein
MLERSTSIRRPLDAHIWAPEEHGYYIEPHWCDKRLFEAESFVGSVWDPSSGSGRIVEAARAAGYRTVSTDIVDRGSRHFDQTLDFLQCGQLLGDNIICNHPAHCIEAFVRHALELAPAAMAMIWILRRLPAARWLAGTPLARIHLLTPRPSMPPGQVIEAGEKPSGGSQDFCWLVWRRGYVGLPELLWLHRDGGPL